MHDETNEWVKAGLGLRRWVSCLVEGGCGSKKLELIHADYGVWKKILNLKPNDVSKIDALLIRPIDPS